jgi:hypothetical protein
MRRYHTEDLTRKGEDNIKVTLRKTGNEDVKGIEMAQSGVKLPAVLALLLALGSIAAANLSDGQF